MTLPARIFSSLDFYKNIPFSPKILEILAWGLSVGQSIWQWLSLLFSEYTARPQSALANLPPTLSVFMSPSVLHCLFYHSLPHPHLTFPKIWMRGQARNHFRKWLCFSKVIIGMFHFKNTGLIEVDEIKTCFCYFGPTWILHPSEGLFHSQLNSLSFFCCSVAQSWLTLCDPMDGSTPCFPVLHYFLEFAQPHVHWVSDAIQTSRPLSSPSPPNSIFPSIRVFSNESALASGGQNIGPSASILPMNIQDYFPLGLTGWISLQSKGLSSPLQYHSSRASILWHSAFFVVQLSHPYMTTGKAIAFTIWTFFRQSNVSSFQYTV